MEAKVRRETEEKIAATLSEEAAAKVRSREKLMGLVEKWIDAKSRGSREIVF